MNIARAFAVATLACVATAAGAAERHYWIGIHDFNVPEVNSNTYGISGGVAFDKETESGRHFVASLDLFADRDKDDLDPDHIPIRWDVHLGSDGKFWQSAPSYFGWTADFNTRMNTVSSVEREMTALPALVGRIDGNVFQPSLKAGAGWFFLEIDDDVPKTRGYDRGDFRNSTFGYSVAGDLTIKLGSCCKLYGQAQKWWDGHDWLQNQYEAALRIGVGGWMEGGELMLSADYYEYNLDVYQRPGEPAILPWNDDLLIRLWFKTSRWPQSGR